MSPDSGPPNEPGPGKSGGGATAPTFEQALGRLEQLVHDLEEGHLGLADGLARYEEGIKLLRQCYELLEHAERRIELLSRVGAQGEPITEPFDSVSDTLAAETLEEKSNQRSRRRSRKSTEKVNDIAPSDDPPAGLF